MGRNLNESLFGALGFGADRQADLGQIQRLEEGPQSEAEGRSGDEAAAGRHAGEGGSQGPAPQVSLGFAICEY